MDDHNPGIPMALPPFSPLPGWGRVAVLVLSLVTAISAAGMAAMAALLPPHPVWVLAGFETVIAVAGVIGLVGWKGRFDVGQGLYLACIAGTVFTGGFLGFLGVRQGVSFGGEGTTSMVPWAAGRMALAGAFTILAVYAVLRRSRAARGYFVRGMIVLILLGGLAAPFVVANGLPSWLGGEGPFQYAILALIGLVAMALLCAGGHCLIRAFEEGRTEAGGLAS